MTPRRAGSVGLGCDARNVYGYGRLLLGITFGLGGTRALLPTNCAMTGGRLAVHPCGTPGLSLRGMRRIGVRAIVPAVGSGSVGCLVIRKRGFHVSFSGRSNFLYECSMGNVAVLGRSKGLAPGF